MSAFAKAGVESWWHEVSKVCGPVGGDGVRRSLLMPLAFRPRATRWSLGRGSSWLAEVWHLPRIAWHLPRANL